MGQRYEALHLHVGGWVAKTLINAIFKLIGKV